MVYFSQLCHHLFQLIVLQHHQERDPIERVRKLILAHDLATAAELKVPTFEIR
jgi:TPP-dependent pyruvate/acetoin dehydrogenase alpha subunit